jgi:hypothetical protein
VPDPLDTVDASPHRRREDAEDHPFGARQKGPTCAREKGPTCCTAIARVRRPRRRHPLPIDRPAARLTRAAKGKRARGAARSRRERRDRGEDGEHATLPAASTLALCLARWGAGLVSRLTSCWRAPTRAWDHLTLAGEAEAALILRTCQRASARWGGWVPFGEQRWVLSREHRSHPCIRMGK